MALNEIATCFPASNTGTYNHSELNRTFPTSVHRQHSAKENSSSTPSSPLHHARGEDSKQVNGYSPHRRPSAAFAVLETETGTHSSASIEEGETAEGGGGGGGGRCGHGLDDNGDTPTRVLVGEDDVDKELDGVTMATAAIVGGEKTLGDIEAGGVSTGTAKIVWDRRGVKESAAADTADSIAGGNGGRAKDDLNNAGNGGEAWQHNRQHRVHRNRSSRLARKGFAQEGDDDIGRDVFDIQHGDDDQNSCSSTELTLGRPDPTSVHWKFSRRLLQT